MAVVHKTFAAKVKQAAKDSGDPPGTFEALVSVFGNKDHGGDIVEAGAFTKSLAEWTLKERPVPIVWAHQFRDVDNILGKYVEIKETEEGLYVKGQLDLNHPRAARVHALMEEGLIVEFSWSGEVREYEWLEDDDEDSWWPGMKILDVDLWEAGPCFKGANPETELLSIKTDGRLAGRLVEPGAAKAGRVLSQRNLDSLTAARDAIDEVIKTAVPADQDNEDATEDKTGEDTTSQDAAKAAAPQTVQRASAATPRSRALLAFAQIH